MLTIRKTQMAVLGEVAVDGFVERAVEILQQTWPVTCGRLGPRAICDRVRQGLSNAGSYGITGQRSVLRFVNLLFAFGDGFFADPRYPWAAEIMSRRELSAEERLDRVIERAVDVLLREEPG